MVDGDQDFDAWNPGLSSEIPARLLPLVTLYRKENAYVGYREAKEAADFCGMKPQDMTGLRASRLVVHEVLIRVTADFYVPDGPNYEELGLNLRSMVGRIVDGYLTPRMAEIEREFTSIRSNVEKVLGDFLERDVYGRTDASQTEEKQSFLGRLLKKKAAPVQTRELPEISAIADWQAKIAAQSGDDLEQACLTGLHLIVSGIVGRRGRLLADKELVLNLAANWVCNSYGSSQLGILIQPIILEAAKAEGFRLLPYQAEPFIMNVKGASGAGKSTIRPLQRELAGRLGISWEDFALISPDYWRKYLFDYRSLGEDFKYGAMLTGQELEIIDKKLDRYMELKAMRREMPHLLIDRFRFDSFSPTSSTQSDGRLLSRFGATVFLFFVITPPTETVERAWKRGIETGRYKAVDDLLYHNIEAYTGMPQLFFSWVNKERQKIHFEFLDNDVPYGQRPKTAAFGWNHQITILDVDCMRRLNRYTNINVEAKKPSEVFLPETGPPEDMLLECIENVPVVTVADPVTLKVKAQYRDGHCVYGNDIALLQEGKNTDHPAPSASPVASSKGSPECTIDLEFERKFIIGVSGLNEQGRSQKQNS